MTEHLLKVTDLKMHFPIYGGILHRKVGTVYAVDGVSLSVDSGQTVGLVGESGCGKTTVGRTIIRLYKPTGGELYFNGTNIANAGTAAMKHIRRDLQMIFQDPFESLNSRHTIARILEEPFVIHGIGTASERLKSVERLMDRVGLTKRALERFPHEFSGGQRQRIGIARAIALKPKMVICDEPVSALDVSIQSQILNLLLELQAEMGLSYLFIAHDLAVVKHLSDFIAVMYLGKIVEYADAEILYQNPRHPYSRALISAIPVPDPGRRNNKRQILKGDVPSPVNPPRGCRFNTRCPHAEAVCMEKEPALLPVTGSPCSHHVAACHFSDRFS